MNEDTWIREGGKIFRIEPDPEGEFKQRPELSADMVMDIMMLDAMANGQEGVSRVLEEDQKNAVSALAFSDRMPGKLGHNQKHYYEQLGFVFGKEVDDLFVEAKLPEGWTKESEGGYWTYLKDEKGRKRGSIFYKSAFYDRDAFCSLNTRYSIRTEYVDVEGFEGNGTFYGVYDEVIQDFFYKTRVLHRHEYSKDFGDRSPENRVKVDEYFAAQDQLQKEVQDWIEVAFPLYKDPTAYWDQL